LPGRADAHYYRALIAAAAEPLSTTPKRRIEAIVQSLDTSIQLGQESVLKARRIESGLPWLLKAAVGFEYYRRNGLISRIGEPAELIAETRRRHCDGDEVDRLLDALSGTSEWTRRQLSDSRSVPDIQPPP
jgi:hypothetical protein